MKNLLRGWRRRLLLLLLLFGSAFLLASPHLFGQAPLQIEDVQGSHHLSPFNGQAVQNIGGIVTATTQDGFFLQDDQLDRNPASSAAIFVFGGRKPDVQVGDKVAVSGIVTEFRPGNPQPEGNPNNLTLTQIGDVAKGGLPQPPAQVRVLSSQNPLPSATRIGQGGRQQPVRLIRQGAMGGNVENPKSRFVPSQYGMDFYESLEGMRVELREAQVVGATDERGVFYLVPDRGRLATGMNPRGGITVRKLGTNPYLDGDLNPERIAVDDTLLALQPGSSRSPRLNVGDRLDQISGILSYEFSHYRLLPIQPLPQRLVHPGNLQREKTSLQGDAHHLTIASFNVENLNPGAAQSKDFKFTGNRITAIAEAIVSSLGSPDIVGLQEVQDNSGPEDDGVVAADQTARLLVAAIAAAGGPTYQYIDIPPLNNQEGGQPGGNIRVAFLFNPQRVQLMSGQAGRGDATTATTVLAGGGLSLSPGRIDPLNPAFRETRKSLVAQFRFREQDFVVINNHWSSKRGDQPLYGPNQPPDLPSNQQRQTQAAIVHQFVQTLLSQNPATKVIVLGDLNDFGFSPPLETLKGQPPLLVNLAEQLPEVERYSYVFQGNAQELDHVLVSSALQPRAQFDIVHLNAEFHTQLSDHDPCVARLLLP
uniref:Endonuclease/exonuclease/phosphatase n=1 Tax=Cyanothece sp. (strain PCC 7425 / ATCC 29141) TaxID=395961 RepID=B8HX73_CYAP4